MLSGVEIKYKETDLQKKSGLGGKDELFFYVDCQETQKDLAPAFSFVFHVPSFQDCSQWFLICFIMFDFFHFDCKWKFQSLFTRLRMENVYSARKITEPGSDLTAGASPFAVFNSS